MDNAQRRISAADFKANCLRLMDEVAQRRAPIVITKRGKPIAKLVPVEEAPIDIFGRMAGTARICGDIVGSIDVEWTGDAENV
ncbi:MAG TPA: type II toxin-antitoxin system Phd/YefM family antitoxin [Stellaceae bacterium]|nr:type II toxin-antitoxin system Phd/YefM family antitoxin [Stellaceae bacterium]